MRLGDGGFIAVDTSTRGRELMGTAALSNAIGKPVLVMIIGCPAVHTRGDTSRFVRTDVEKMLEC